MLSSDRIHTYILLQMIRKEAITNYFHGMSAALISKSGASAGNMLLAAQPSILRSILLEFSLLLYPHVPPTSCSTPFSYASVAGFQNTGKIDSYVNTTGSFRL